MIRFVKATIVATLATASTQSIGAQALASRVDAINEGRVQFNFAARPGVCGNGKTWYSTSPGNINGNFYGNFNDMTRTEQCVPGPVRVVIDRAEKMPISIQTYVGPLEVAPGTTDLGRVRAQDAADYLLSIASKTEGRAGRDAISPALLADSANTATALVNIARNQALPRETRRQALSAMGRSTEGMASIPASVTDPLLGVARDETDNQSVRQSALSVLGRLDHGAGIPSLISLSQQTQSNWLAKESMSVLARSGDPRARQYLRTAVRRTDLPEEVLSVALRSLGQEFATAQDAALLRQLYPTLKSDRTREAVFSAITEMGGAENTKWLLDMARNENELLNTRRKAAEAASRSGASITELVRLYDTTTDSQMKETLIGIYIRNSEKVAVDKLLSIIKDETNMPVRRNTISRLRGSEDPRIRQALQDLVIRG